jgi:hypothetical protein
VTVFADASHGVEAVEHRHRNIDQNYLRIQAKCSLDKIFPVSDRAEQFKLVVQQTLQALCEQHVIVGE